MLFLSTGLLALPSHAYAQSAPDTRQTDQSEEDWRKSQKKTGDTDDIIDIIKNTRGSGVGNGRGFSPVDALPEESRRHLIKERAKRLAQAGPNEPVDLTYTPSEAAKADANLESEEKEAWEQLAQKVKNEQFAAGQGGQQGQASQTGQQRQGGQSDQQGQSSSNDQSRSNSVLRGGSSASVADIMAQLKGLGQAPSGQPGGSLPSGQAPSGQNANQGQQNTPSEQSQAGQDRQSGTDSAPQNGEAQGQDNAAGVQSQGQDSSVDASQAAQNAARRTPEPISPLEHLKNARQGDDGRGARASASDFLKKKD